MENCNNNYSCWIPSFSLEKKLKIKLLFGWGINPNGVLGDGTTTQANIPVQTITNNVLNKKIIKKVISGYGNSGIITSNNEVYTWGNNNFGTLGNGTTGADILEPSGPILDDTLDLSIGLVHMLSLNYDGTIKSWGRNSFGQLGDGTTGNSSSPIIVSGVTGVKQILASKYSSFSLLEDGSIKSWGNNEYGQLGNGTTGVELSPITVLGGNTFIKISGKDESIVGISTDKTVWTWGNNEYGQLGNGTTGYESTPVQVLGVGGTGSLQNIKDVGCWNTTMMAIDELNRVYAWGDNTAGQFGNGTTGVGSNFPVEIIGLPSNIISLEVGYYSSSALTSNGKVYSWGLGDNGQMGNGTLIQINPTPVLVNDLGYPFNRHISQISIAFGHILALSK